MRPKRLLAIFAFLLLPLSVSDLGAARFSVEVIAVYYSNASDFVEPLSVALSEQGRLAVSERTNSIIVRDFPENIRAVKKLLKQLDVIPRQVKITVGVVEKEKLKEAGIKIQWFASGPNWSIGNLQTGVAAFGGSSINMLMTERRVRILSRQMLVLRDNAEGSIFVGDEVPHVSYIIDYGKRHGTITKNVEFRKVGSSLRVKPRIIGDDEIEISVSPELSRPDGKGGIVLSSASTLVIVKNGQTILLGGNNENEGSFGSKFLTSYISRDRSKELAISLTATIQ